jgi:hypothetical protein
LIILVLSLKLTERVIDKKIRNGRLSKSRTEKLIINLDFWGAFVLVTALGAVSGMAFVSSENPILSIPAVASLYNPMIGLYLLAISWKLKMDLHCGHIK